MNNELAMPMTAALVAAESPELAEPLTALNNENLTRGTASEHYEQLQALLVALGQLQRLANLDPSAYQSTLVGQSTSETTVADPQARLEQLQRQWKLEETPVPSLARTIHRFHSNINTLRSEVDEQAAEMDALRQQLEQAKEQKRALQRAGKLLQAKNEQLHSQLQESKKEKKTLVKHVKDFVRQMRLAEEQQKELHEMNDIYKLQAHEHFLMRMIDSSSSNNRLRLDSTDSTMTATTEEGSVSSVSSLVTDEGIATVRFAAIHSPTGMTLDDSNGSLDFVDSPPMSPTSSSKPSTYTLTFPRGTKIGLKIRPVPLSTVPVKKPVPKNPGNEQLTNALKADDTSFLKHALASGAETFQEELPQQHGFSLNPLSLLGMNKDAAQKNDNTEAEAANALLVVGYTDTFDDKLNVKPAIGARIVAVNGQSASVYWTVGDLTLRINESTSESYSLSFQNVPLTAEQREILSMPTKDYQAKFSPKRPTKPSIRSAPPLLTTPPRKNTATDVSNDDSWRLSLPFFGADESKHEPEEPSSGMTLPFGFWNKHAEGSTAA